MGWLSTVIGGTTAAGVSATLNGVEDAAIKLREAITGDMPPEKKALSSYAMRNSIRP